MLETVNEIFGEQLIKDINVNVPEGLLKISKIIDDLAKKSVSGSALSEIVKATTALNKAQDLLNKSYAITSKAQQDAAKLAITEAKAKEALSRADIQAAKADAERSKVAERNNRTAAASARQLAKEEADLARLTNELTNDYGLLSKAYNEAALKAKNYSLQLGASNPQTIEAIAAAKKMGDTLKALDASVGQHNRNVGNYAESYNGLNNSIQQILREAPSAAVSLNTFFLAISNNLPIFFDEVQKIRKAQQQQVAESKLAQKAAYDEAEARAIAAKQTDAQAKAAGKLAAAEAIATPEQLKAAAAARLGAEASARQAGATEAQAIAAGNLAAQQTLANVAQARAPSLMAQIGKSIFSINTLLTLAVLGLTLFGGKIINMIKGINGISEEAEKINKKYAESIKQIEESSRDAAQQDIARLSVLTKLAADEEQTMRTRLRSIKELQETYPATFGALSQQAILEGKLGDAVNRTTQALLDRAAYQAAEKKFAAASERVYDLTVQQEDAQKKLNKAKETYNKLNEKGLSRLEEEAGVSLADDANARMAKASIMVKNLTEEIKTAQDEANRYLSDAQKSAAKAGDVLFTKDPKTKDTSSKLLRQQMREEDKARAERLAAERELTDAQRDNLNAQLEQSIQHNKYIYENDEYTLDQRIEAYAEYYSSRQRQSESNAKKELEDIIQLEKEIAFVEKEPEKRRSDADKALLLRKEAIAERRKGIEYKLQADLTELQSAAAKDTIKIFESESDQIVKEVETRNTRLMDANEKAANAQLVDLGNQYKNGEISYSEYLKKRENIEREYLMASLRAQIESTDLALKNEELSTEDRDKLTKKSHDLKMKLSEEEHKAFMKKDKEKKDIIKAAIDFAFSAANSTLDAISGLYDHEDKKREEQFDKSTTRNDERLQEEIKLINASALSQEEKDKQIEIAQAKREAIQKTIDQQRKQAEIAAAKRNKAISIAQIILSTAQAVIAALSMVPFTPANFFTAAAAGVLGAGQLAVAVATPIPQYAKGTMFHKGGLMEVGDGNERELIKEPNKAPYWSPDTDTIMWAKRGTQVIPERKITAMTNVNAIKTIDSMGGMTQNRYDKEVVNALNKNNATLRGVGEAIKNKQEFHMELSERGLQFGAKAHKSWTEYVGRIINI